MGRIKIASHLTRAVVSRASVQMDLRPRIPAAEYLQILHHAAMTGQMPIFRRNDRGLFEVTTESQPIDVNDRLNIMQSLIKKVLPDMRDTDDSSVTETLANEVKTTDVVAERLATMSMDDLKAIAAKARIPEVTIPTRQSMPEASARSEAWHQKQERD